MKTLKISSFLFLRSLSLLLIFVSKPESTSSQNSKILKITYTKNYRSELDTTKAESHKNEINKLNLLISKYSKEISYELIVTSDHSLFSLNEFQMDQSEHRLKKLAASIGDTDGKFYVNKKDSVYLHERHFSGDDFLIKMEVKQWKLTNEFKFISKFKCYKAISEDIVSNLKGVFKSKVVAWFCPELPSFFGPAKYFGLPGLILELDNGKMNLKATKIYFSTVKKDKIKPPKKGIKMTPKEFDKFLKEKAKEMFPNFFKKNK